MTLVVFVGKRFAEFLISPLTANILWRATPDGIEEEWIVEVGDSWKGLFDLDGMRPAIAEVVEVLERPRADIFDRGEKGCFASVDRVVKAAVWNAEADVTDAKLVEMAVAPAVGRLKNLMKPIKRERNEWPPAFMIDG